MLQFILLPMFYYQQKMHQKETKRTIVRTHTFVKTIANKESNEFYSCHLHKQAYLWSQKMHTFRTGNFVYKKRSYVLNQTDWQHIN